VDEAGRTTDGITDPEPSKPGVRVGGARPGPPPARPKPARTPQIFAIIGVVVALAAASLYLFTKDEAPARLTPEQAVGEFLSGVFLSADPARVSPVVCASWNPSDAISRTTGAVEAGAHVSWDEIAIVSSSDARASATARLGIRLRDDTGVSVRRKWRFNLVDEDGWRVCDARPLT